MNNTYSDSYTFKDYLGKTMITMALGLAITALSSFLFGFVNPMIIYRLHTLLLIAQLGLVFFFSRSLMTMSKGAAWICYIAYSALMGISLSSITYVYAGSTITMAFATTTVLFVCMAVIGQTTNVDLTKFSNIFMIGLVGLLIATILNNWFIHSSMADMLLCYFGVILFLGLIAYDIQKLHQFYSLGFSDPELMEKITIYGAFELYLDFLNLFLRVLQVFANRRNSRN